METIITGTSILDAVYKADESGRNYEQEDFHWSILSLYQANLRDHYSAMIGIRDLRCERNCILP